MNLLNKFFKREERSMTLKDRDGWDSILGPTSRSGVNVTSARALSVPAALSAVRLLSEAVASLPLVVYRKDRQGGRERAQDHPLYRLLHNAPNERQTAFMFKEVIMLGLLTDGNGYALIDWASNGQPTALWPIAPSRVSVEQDPYTGQVVYKITHGTGQTSLSPADVLHVPGMCFDGLRGSSLIQAARESIGGAIAELEHGSSFFQNAAMPSGVLKHPGRLKDTSLESLRASWNTSYSGINQAHRTAILEEGMTFEPISLSNKDSQWLESRAFSVKEIARIFRVPPHLLGDLEKSSYSSVEAQNLEFLTYSLRPWLSRLEEVINLKLFSPKEAKSYYVEFLTADLLRSDTKNRFEAYRTAIQSGWMSINEVRKLENLPPVDNGDVHLFQLNQAPLEALPEQQRVEKPTLMETIPQAKTETRSLRDINKEKLENLIRSLLEEEASKLMPLVAKSATETQIKEIAAQFYGARHDEVVAKVTPLYREIVEKVNQAAAKKLGKAPWTASEIDDHVARVTEVFARKHIAVGKQIVLNAAMEEDPYLALGQSLEDGVQTRPSKVAHLESTGLQSNASLSTYRMAGVEAIMWKANPDCCEFCAKLDGKIVSIGQPFIDIGETVVGPPGTWKNGKPGGSMTARFPRVSPPAHLGCACEIEPVIL